MKQTWASRLLVGLLGLGLLLFFVAVMAISGRVALAQDAGTTSTSGAFLASSTDEQAGLAGPASVLPGVIRFRLRLVHSVRFPLTEQRCYFQFFFYADGSSPLEGASLALELVEDGRVVGLNRVEIADLIGKGLSRRVREFAFDGPCSLDGLRLISATGAFQPAGDSHWCRCPSLRPERAGCWNRPDRFGVRGSDRKRRADRRFGDGYSYGRVRSHQRGSRDH
ncbi:MAG: hypothetical protein CME02_06765 [Geminicoccus sp.]|nr:hypothetical protein [Geminicoccus sp.]